MNSSLACLSFQELLALNEAETARWQRWFEQQAPSVLDLPIAIANARTVRDFLLHIFAVELRHSERLMEFASITAYESLPTESVSALFGIGARARALLREYLSTATEQEFRQVIEMQTRSAGTLRASKRKLVAHIFVHGIRHWAQLATAVREHCSPTDWRHDVLFMEEFDSAEETPPEIATA